MSDVKRWLVYERCYPDSGVYCTPDDGDFWYMVDAADYDALMREWVKDRGLALERIQRLTDEREAARAKLRKVRDVLGDSTIDALVRWRELEAKNG